MSSDQEKHSDERNEPAREVFFLIGQDDGVLHRDPHLGVAGASAVRIPDSRDRWELIWRERDRLVEIAHSHPVGPLAFSEEDETTMSALATALGRTIMFSVVTQTAMIRRTVEADGALGPVTLVTQEPAWASDLRRASGL